MQKFRTLQDKFDFLRENFFTKETIETTTDLLGYSEETASKLLNYATGYHNFEKYLKYREEIFDLMYDEYLSQIWGTNKAQEKDL